MRAEQPGHQHEWLDGAAGPVVRPYTLTGGRVRPAVGGFDLVAFVLAAAGVDPYGQPGLQPEHRRLVEYARQPVAIVDLAADLDLALGVIAGPEPDEAKGYRLDLARPRHTDLANYRVLVLDQHPAATTDSEIRGALDALATQLDGLCAQVARSSDRLPDLAAQHGVYMGLLGPAMSRGAPGAEVINAHQWMNLLDAQVAFRRRWDEFFEAFDVVVMPTLGSVAFPHDDNPDTNARTLQINGEATPYFGQLAWPGVALLPNLPSTVAPIGQTKGGLPIGVQIMGPYLEDRTTIAFAGLLERTFGGFKRPPGY